MTNLRLRAEAQSYRALLTSPTDHKHTNITPHLPDPQEEEEDYTLKDLNADLTVLLNILFSIVACAAAVWLVAGAYEPGTRLGLAMVAAGVVAGAEVVLLGGYYRRIGEARGKEGGRKERETVLRSWVAGEGDGVVGEKEDGGKKVDGEGSEPVWVRKAV